MVIRNIGSKIVNIGSTALMPDQTMPATKAIIETPAIKALVKKKFLAIEEDAKAPKKPKEDDAAKKAAEEAAKKAAEEAAKKATEEATKNGGEGAKTASGDK